MPWLQGDQFDAVMNYPLTNAITEYFAKENISASEFAQSVTAVTNLYPETVNEVQFNLLGSHDTPRILTLSNNSKGKVKLQMLVQFTMAGTPCVYYGDEVSMTGGQDPGCRKCMPWDKNKHDEVMFTFVQKLISLRKQYKIFRTNENLSFLESSDKENVVIYSKEDINNEILIIINNNDQEKDITIPTLFQNKQSTDLWINKEETLNTTIHLNPYDFHIFLIQK